MLSEEAYEIGGCDTLYLKTNKHKVQHNIYV